MIYATAKIERIPLITKDRRISSFSSDDPTVPIIW